MTYHHRYNKNKKIRTNPLEMGLKQYYYALLEKQQRLLRVRDAVMMRVNKLTDYATVLLAYMAGDPDTTYSASELSKSVVIALPTVSKILKMMVRGGLIRSIRGAMGGYQLARSPSEITVAQIVTAIEGEVAMTECSSSHGHCYREPRCAVRHNWMRINQAVFQALASVTLEEMNGQLVPPVIQFGEPHDNRE
jgi:FeS assembly SUF system regulator